MGNIGGGGSGVRGMGSRAEKKMPREEIEAKLLPCSYVSPATASLSRDVRACYCLQYTYLRRIDWLAGWVGICAVVAVPKKINSADLTPLSIPTMIKLQPVKHQSDRLECTLDLDRAYIIVDDEF